MSPTARAGFIAAWMPSTTCWAAAAGTPRATIAAFMAVSASALISACGFIWLSEPGGSAAAICGLVFANSVPRELWNSLFTIDPSTAAPTVPPMERKKVVAEVTTPAG